MLINARTPEELRVAIVDGSTLEDFQVEVAERGSTRGNIYRGTIAKIEPSLNAAFIDYGAERHGFLAIQDVVPEAYYREPKDKGRRPKIDEVLERGKPIVVQVTKEPEPAKGAALTTNLSLAGRYLVLTPFDATRGVSRKVEDEETRKRLKDVVAKLDVPDGCGVIVRTNSLDQNKATLSRDLAALSRMWKKVSAEARTGKGAKLIYSDQDLVLQALRDYLDPEIAEIVVDDDEMYGRAEEYLKSFLPRGGDRLVRYAEREPLFARYGLEPQIDRIHERRVYLKSGGSIVIDRTEALTAIDVNSGRSTKAATQEQTALATNLEAAEEVARQLRLRDIGGLVVVDFIDMRASRSQKKVEKALRDAMKADKARSSVGRISDNGLLEINRQRIHQALSLRTHRTCPACDGTGRVPSPEMVGLNLIRRIEARAATAQLERVRIALSPDLADAVQNGRRRELAALEREFGLRIEVVGSHRLSLIEQEVEWVKREGGGNGRPAVHPAIVTPSVRAGQLAEEPEGDEATVDVEGADEAAAGDGSGGERESQRSRGRSRRRRGGERRLRVGESPAASEGDAGGTGEGLVANGGPADEPAGRPAEGAAGHGDRGRTRERRRVGGGDADARDGKGDQPERRRVGGEEADAGDGGRGERRERRRAGAEAAETGDGGGDQKPERKRRRVGGEPEGAAETGSDATSDDRARAAGGDRAEAAGAAGENDGGSGEGESGDGGSGDGGSGDGGSDEGGSDEGQRPRRRRRRRSRRGGGQDERKGGQPQGETQPAVNRSAIGLDFRDRKKDDDPYAGLPVVDDDFDDFVPDPEPHPSERKPFGRGPTPTDRAVLPSVIAAGAGGDGGKRGPRRRGGGGGGKPSHGSAPQRVRRRVGEPRPDEQGGGSGSGRSGGGGSRGGDKKGGGRPRRRRRRGSGGSGGKGDAN